MLHTDCTKQSYKIKKQNNTKTNKKILPVWVFPVDVVSPVVWVTFPKVFPSVVVLFVTVPVEPVVPCEPVVAPGEPDVVPWLPEVEFKVSLMAEHDPSNGTEENVSKSWWLQQLNVNTYGYSIQHK
jgi:hypothetical protein